MVLTLGCDPELVARLNGKMVNASDYYKKNSSFGLDGFNSIAEIRPGYDESPIDLVAKIKKVIEYGHEKAPELEFFAGHFQEGCSLGGHIHFGGILPKSNVIDSLDAVLYSLSNVIDDKTQRENREKTGYGRRGAWRDKQHGFEYRTPGSWLLSPAIALVTLTLAKLTAIASYEYNLDLSKAGNLTRSDIFLKNIRKHLTFPIPEDCEEGLSLLITLLHKKIDWNQNILPFWGLN